MEQVEEMKMNKNSLTSSKSGCRVPQVQAPGAYEGLAAAKGPVCPGSLCDLLAAEVMIAFWFGIGAILAIKMVNSLEELISRK